MESFIHNWIADNPDLFVSGSNSYDDIMANGTGSLYDDTKLMKYLDICGEFRGVAPNVAPLFYCTNFMRYMKTGTQNNPILESNEYLNANRCQPSDTYAQPYYNNISSSNELHDYYKCLRIVGYEGWQHNIKFVKLLNRTTPGSPYLVSNNQLGYFPIIYFGSRETERYLYGYIVFKITLTGTENNTSYTNTTRELYETMFVAWNCTGSASSLSPVTDVLLLRFPDRNKTVKFPLDSDSGFTTNTLQVQARTIFLYYMSDENTYNYISGGRFMNSGSITVNTSTWFPSNATPNGPIVMKNSNYSAGLSLSIWGKSISPQIRFCATRGGYFQD